MSQSESLHSNNQLQLDTLVNYDTAGLPHRPDGGFMSNAEVTAIDNNRDVIADGLGGFDLVRDKQIFDLLEADERAETLQAERTALAHQKELVAVAAKQEALTTLSGLMQSGVTLDGPTLTKAGIGYDKRLSLGYQGSIDTMVEDAQALQDIKDAQQRSADYHARNNKKAEEWRRQKDSLRETRQATDQRINELVSGEAAVKDLTYKQKLEAGGEFGVSARQKNAQMSEQAAIVAAEESGMDVSHRKPRTLQVSRNIVAENTAAETVSELKRFDADMYRSKTTTPEDTAQDEATSRQARMYQKIQARLDARSANRNSDGSGLLFAKTERTDNDPRTSLKERFAAAIDKVRPYGSSVKAGTQKLQHASLMAYEKLINRSATQEFIRTDVNEKRNKQVAYAAVVGVIAVYAASKFGAMIDNPFDGSPMAAGGHSGSLQQGIETGGNSAPVSIDTATIVPGDTLVQDIPHTETTLSSGDSIWSISEHALGKNVSAHHIDQLKDAILEQNNLTERQATHLPSGTVLHMPIELIEELQKSTKK